MIENAESPFEKIVVSPVDKIITSDLHAQQKYFPPIIPLKKWPENFGYPSIGTLKYLALRRKENGFDRCLRMISGRLYLDTEETLKWFKEGKDE
jgi:hypothetical protein